MKNKYLNLDRYLGEIKKEEQQSIIISVLISLEKDYYAGESFNIFCKNLKQDILDNKFQNIKIDSIRFEIGDTLNRHNWYYRYCSEYMIERGLNDNKEIPKEKKVEFSKKSYKKSKEQGLEWFHNNIAGINNIIPENKKISQDIILNHTSINTLYDGDEIIPKLDFIMYDYWLNHPKYKEVEEAMLTVMSFDINNIINRAYNHEAAYFYDRLKLKQEIKHKNLFLEQSYKYLFDETMPYIIKHSENKNLIEFYLNGRDMQVSLAFKGRKIKNDLQIQEYLKGPLKGADQRKFVSVKISKE